MFSMVKRGALAAGLAACLLGSQAGAAQAHGDAGCVGFPDGMGSVTIGDEQIELGRGPYYCLGDEGCVGFPNGLGLGEPWAPYYCVDPL